MQIRSYNDNPQGFLDDLGTVNLDQLTGSHSSALDPLLAFIKEKGIQISASGSSPFINEELLKKMLAYFMPEDAIVKGGYYDSQIKGGIEHLKALLTKAVNGDPAANPPVPAKTTWSLQEFMALAHFSLTGDRVDDDVIAAMQGSMHSHTQKRNELKGEISALTAELRIYSIVQSQISTAQQNSGTVQTGRHGVNLFNYQLYGYTSHADFVKKDKDGNYNPQYALLKIMAKDRLDAYIVWLESSPNGADRVAEAKLEGYSGTGAFLAQIRNELASLNNDAPGVFFSIRDFLISPKKDTGPIGDIKFSYSYDKDNNPLSNFATTVSDRAKPLNDKVSQKTTELNDVSSRYNSAIEALNKFIQKYESMMQQILQAI